MGYIDPTHLETNDIPDSMLRDYSCLDNIKTRVRTDTTHRLYVNYTSLAASFYDLYRDNSLTTLKIGNLVKRHDSEVSGLDLRKGFKQIIKYRSAVPYILELLQLSGIFIGGLESSFKALAFCKVEQVRIHYIIQPKQTITFDCRV
jgi:hypothetical protein